MKGALACDLRSDSAPSPGDTSDALMVYIFSLALSVPRLAREVLAWAVHAEMPDKTQPLKGWQAEKWDAR